MKNIKLICLTASFLVSAVACSGCVERRLTINTEPQGAIVFLNDEEIGTSPVTTSFMWYGDYKVRIRKQGCETIKTHRKLKAPWYDYLPFDFFAQVVYPGKIVDSYTWQFNLQPQTEISREKLIKNARNLKQQL